MNVSLQPAVEINGRVIPSQLIAAEAQNHPAPAGKPGIAWRAAARALAVQALLLQEAERLGLHPAPNELAPGKRETDDEALVRAVIDHHVRPAPPDEAACRAAYTADPDRFRAPSLYEAAHILLPAAPNASDARSAAWALAVHLIAEVAREAGAFDRLARDHSACKSRVNGGRLGQIVAGDTVPEFEAALATLPVGGVTPEPVATRFGLHVIRLDARAEGARLAFEAVHPRIRDMLERAAWAREARALVTRLLTESRVIGVDFPGVPWRAA